MTDLPQALGTKYRKPFARIIEWFETRRWQPFDFQIRAWQTYLQGHSGLIHAPTGIGKTYAAFLGPVIAELTKGRRRKTTVASTRAGVRPGKAAPLTVLWITPLRALATDIRQALCEPVAHGRLEWSDESSRV